MGVAAKKLPPNLFVLHRKMKVMTLEIAVIVMTKLRNRNKIFGNSSYI